MIHAYDEMYLSDARRTLAGSFDHAVMRSESHPDVAHISKNIVNVRVIVKGNWLSLPEYR